MKRFLTLAFILFVAAFNRDSRGQQKKNFKVFNALLYKKVPDLTKYGFSKINVIYEDGVVSTNYRVSLQARNRRFPDLKKVSREAALSSRDPKIPICLDVECWNVRTKHRAEATNKYLTVLNEFRRAAPNVLVSFFAQATYNLPIAQASNVFYPSFYTQSKDKKKWFNEVRSATAKLRKVNPNAPIYAFIWPQFNPNSKTNLGYSFIGQEMWKYELETLYKYCDGVVIWSHYKDNNGKVIEFNPSMPWFQTTLAFIKKYNIQ